MSLPYKPTAEELAKEDRQDKLQRLRYMVDMKLKEIAKAQLELEAYQNYIQELLYLEEN